MPKVKMYNKFEPKRFEHGNERGLPEQKKDIGYFERLNGEYVQAHLTTGEQLSGILQADLYNKYDVQIETEEGVYLIRKDVLRCVKYCKSGHNTIGKRNNAK